MRSILQRLLVAAVHWLFFSLCLLLFFNQGALADEPWPPFDGEWLPVTAEEAETPAMTYQPAPDAEHLEQFFPPETSLTRLKPLLGESATVPITPGQNTAVSFNNDQVAVIIESGTYDRPVHLTFQLLASTTITDTRAMIPLDHGEPVSDTEASISHTLVPPTFFQFQLEVYDAVTGQPIEKFDKQVRLVVDLRQLGFPLDAAYHQFYLAYQDEELANESLWVEAPVWVHQPDGLLSAEVSHFSDWTAGWRPEVWTPKWAPPTVSTFSGAATYQYGLEIPPGRNGLQPAVSLSYNSRVLDGAIRDVPEGSVASGWSLADIYIAREGIEIFTEGDHLKLRHPNRFRLVLNGAGHELFPEPGVNTSTATTVRYYAKDAPGLYVKRVYAASGVPNTEGIYWIVKTADGTTYRLGYYSNAEEWQRTEHNWQLVLAGHRGHNSTSQQVHTSATNWHVDTITDLFGNQITYHYHTKITDQYACGDLCGFELRHWQQKVRIATINYNFPDRIELNNGPVPDNVARLSNPGSQIAFHARNAADPLGPIQNIMVYHGQNVSTANPIREYRIESRQVHFDPALTDCPDRSGNYPDRTSTRIVDSIRVWTGTDRNPHSQEAQGSGVYALPPVEMTHEVKAHYYKHNVPSRRCFAFSYLKEVKNGYGGRTVFTYGSDNRSVGQHHVYGYHWVEWPKVGFNFFVTEVRHYDGRNGYTRTTYDYVKPCYGQTSADVGPLAGAFTCPSPGALSHGNIVGFEKTTQTNYDFNGSPALNKEITTFSQLVSTSIGRPTRVDVQKADNTLLTRTDTVYTPAAVGGLNNMFTYTSRVINTQYHNGAGSINISSKVEYEYATANQGNVQYGNLTHTHEYDSAGAGTPYRTTIRNFYPHTTNWVVGLMGGEGVYNSSGTLLRATWYHYDGNNGSAGTPPPKGALTRLSQAIPITCAAVPGGGGSGCAHARQTIDTYHTHDVYGNVKTSTTYPGYGYRTFNSSWGLVKEAPPSSEARTTTLAYENQFNLYPVSVKNTLNQETTFEIYGFRNAAGTLVNLHGWQRQTGLLKEVNPPDNVITRYEYDPFGRLHTVFDGFNFSGFGNSDAWDGNPVALHRYWDNSWNNTTTFLNPSGHAPFQISVQQRPLSQPQPANSSSGFAYNDQTFYDGFGRPIQTRSLWHWVEGQSKSREIITSTAYNALGQVSCQTAPYDIQYYSDQGKTWPQSPFVNEACTSKPRTTTTYDALARPLTVTGPDGLSTTYSYFIINTVTVDGRNILALTNIKDANNHIVGQMSNSLGQLAMVQENQGSSTYTADARTRYYYDLLGNLKEVRTTDGTINGDPNPTGPETLRRVVMGYDNFGRKTGMTDPDMGTWSYVYDAPGNLVSQVDAKGQRLCFSYDSLDRPTFKRHDSNNNGCDSGDVQLARYLYFGSGTGKVGQVSEIRWSASSTQNRETFDYDTLGRLTNHTRYVDSRQYTMNYGSFDALYRPQNRTITYPNGNTETVAVTFDREGENTLSAGGTSLVTTVGYNGRGQIKRLALNNGLSTWYGYHGYEASGTHDIYDARSQSWNWPNLFGRLWRICTATHANTRCQAANKDLSVSGQVLDIRHSYDNVGNVTAVRDYVNSNQVQSFGYDHRNRLTSAATNGVGSGQYSHSYAYNKIGNITNFAGVNYGYNSAAHKQAVTHLNSVQRFWYDANGNMTKRVEGGVTYDPQVYDVQNRLVSVTKVGTGATTFTYDAAGIRVKTVHPGGKTSYFPFPGYEEEVNGSTTTRRVTYAVAGQTVALRVQVVGGSNTLYYLHSDHLGSTSLASTTTGAVVSGSTSRYHPFGGFRTTPTAGLTDVGYTGHRHNNIGAGDLGLVYMGARFYLPGVGRFLSADTVVPDPQNPQSWNRYGYVENRPLNFTDPTGHYLESAWDAFNVGLGLHSLYTNVRDGNYGWAVVDGVGVVVDVAALAVPVVPGGVGSALKAARGVDMAVDALQTVNRASNAAQTANQAANVAQGAQTVARYADEAVQAGSTTLRNVGSAVSDAARRCSFTADTLVTTATGLWPIASVSVGDYVLAYHEESESIGYYPVSAVWAHDDPVIVYLTIDGELVVTTPEHPFYTGQDEWLPAASLQVGNEIRRANWQTGTIEAITFIASPQTMYNFTVAAAHTYFVGDGQWLVHNSCPIYREGGRNPGNLTPRPQDNGMLSFRDSLSNPWPLPEGQRPVFRPGQEYIAADPFKLPSGSVIHDNIPPGHVSVFNVPPNVIQEAILFKGKFPK